jgi:hypothetical protein
MLARRPTAQGEAANEEKTGSPAAKNPRAPSEPFTNVASSKGHEQLPISVGSEITTGVRIAHKGADQVRGIP